MSTSKVTVELDRTRTIAWGNVASYRLGTLPRPPVFGDLRNPRKAYSVLVAYIWAMLSDAPEDFVGPEQLAAHVDQEKLADYVHAVVAAIRKDAPKKADVATDAHQSKRPGGRAAAGVKKAE